MYFFVKIATPPEKGHLPFSQQTPSKSWGPATPPFWKFGWRFNHPLAERGHAHYALSLELTDIFEL